MTRLPLVSALRCAFALASPSLAVAALILGGGIVWERHESLPLPGDIHDVIIHAQQARAEAAPATDLLIVGDSSALMGIDAPALQEMLSLDSVQSLALFGSAGPSGYAATLRRFSANAPHPPRCLLVAFHGGTLDLPERRFRSHYERTVLQWREQAAWDALARGRDKLFHDLASALHLPEMPAVAQFRGAYGRVYGSPAAFRAHIDAGQGTTIDPNPPLRLAAGGVKGYRYRISSAVRDRLPPLAKAIADAGAQVTYLLITPIPRAYEGSKTAGSRRKVAFDLASSLGIPPDRVRVPAPSLPTRLFVSTTHLTGRGRSEYTRRLAVALPALPDCVENKVEAGPREGSGPTPISRRLR